MYKAILQLNNPLMVLLPVDSLSKYFSAFFFPQREYILTLFCFQTTIHSIMQTLNGKIHMSFLS